MKKLKIKKNVKKLFYIGIILIIFLSIFIYSSINIYNQKQYEKTNEYKLLQLGYNENEVNTLLDKYKNKEIDYILNKEVNKLYLNLVNDKYFIYDNFYEYTDYAKDNLDKTIRTIIEIVNTNINTEHYTNINKADTSKKELVLVNKYYSIDSSYTPEDLVTISMDYSWGTLGSQKATEDTYNAFLKMWNAAYDEGYYLMVSSSYRTYEKQEKIYNEYELKGTEYADAYAARPGHSEHQTGYALDIFEKNNGNQKTFHESDAYLWLKDNAHKYGFILRYKEDQEEITGYSFESWHYRYVGVDVANYIYQNNITFDEYYEFYLN